MLLQEANLKSRSTVRFFYELLGSSFVFELGQKDIQFLLKRILMNVRQRWQSKGKARERYTLIKVGSFFAP